jgi:tRNA (cmo5U34)-methyltransferase
MVAVLVDALPFDRDAGIRVIDLGCGTGTLARAVFQAFPRARMTCVDLAPAMLDLARAKLLRVEDVQYVAADFAEWPLDSPADAVVSSLALHHLETDDDKRRFDGRVYEALAPGGVFYNADVVLGSSTHLQQLYLRECQEFMRRSMSQEEIDREWLRRYREEDRPAPLVAQLSWLETIGFRDVDVLWKYYNFAVYGGVKPEGSALPL